MRHTLSRSGSSGSPCSHCEHLRLLGQQPSAGPPLLGDLSASLFWQLANNERPKSNGCRGDVLNNDATRWSRDIT